MAFNNINYSKEYIQIPYKQEFLNLPPYMTLPGILPPNIQGVTIYPPSNIPPYYNPSGNTGYNASGNTGYTGYNPYSMITCRPTQECWIAVTLTMPTFVTFKGNSDDTLLNDITITSNICGKFIYNVCPTDTTIFPLANNTSDFSTKYFNKCPPSTTLTITPFSFNGQLYTPPVIILEKTKSCVSTNYKTILYGNGDVNIGIKLTLNIVYLYSCYDCKVISIKFNGNVKSPGPPGPNPSPSRVE